MRASASRARSSPFAIQVARICPDGSESMSEFHIAANPLADRRSRTLSSRRRVDLAATTALLLPDRAPRSRACRYARRRFSPRRAVLY